MRIRIPALILALSMVFAYAAAAAEEHSEYWLDSWADEVFREALGQPASAEKPDIPLTGRLVLAYVDQRGKCNVYCKYGGPKADPRPEDPFFQPVYSNGQPIYPEIPASRWADAVENCGWLIVYGGFETGRNTDYYGKGIDRVIVTTRLYVLDPVARRIVLEEEIGTDAPGIRTGSPRGQVLFSEADALITRLAAGDQ